MAAPAGRGRALLEQHPVQEQMLPPEKWAEPGPLRTPGQRGQRVLCQGGCGRTVCVRVGGGQPRAGGPSRLGDGFREEGQPGSWTREEG